MVDGRRRSRERRDRCDIPRGPVSEADPLDLVRRAREPVLDGERIGRKVDAQPQIISRAGYRNVGWRNPGVEYHAINTARDGCVVDHRIAARTASEQIGVAAIATTQGVIGAVATHRVAKRIAGAVDGGRSRQGQVFEIAGERIGNDALHGIDAFIGLLNDYIVGVIDHVGVIARTARHEIRTGAAVNRIIAGPAIYRIAAGIRIDGVIARQRIDHVVRNVADDDVAEDVAGAIDCRSTGQREIFHVVGKCIRDRALHEIDAADVAGI